MVENQHKKITGYRDLTETEIALMNEVKAKAEEVGQLVAKLRSGGAMADAGYNTVSVDPRWVSIGATDLQTGFMALARAIAQPTTF